MDLKHKTIRLVENIIGKKSLGSRARQKILRFKNKRMDPLQGFLDTHPTPQWREDGRPEHSQCRWCVEGSFPMGYVGSFPPNVTPTSRIGCKNEETKFAKERAGLSKLLDLKDAETVQKFFLEEIQLGWVASSSWLWEGFGPSDKCIAVGGQPQQLLQVLQQTSTTSVPRASKLLTINQRIVSAQSMAEDDVE